MSRSVVRVPTDTLPRRRQQRRAMQSCAWRACALALLALALTLHPASGLNRRCFHCRSRGELGTCRDPFPYNVTEADREVGLNVVQCASGWCGKLMEGGNMFKGDDYGMATQRMCLQRGPSDAEERCAYTMWNHRKVFMCFCTGDMCNGGSRASLGRGFLSLAVLIPFYSVLKTWI